MNNNLRRVAFFIRAYNDLDHYTPVIAEFILKKENPLIIVYTDLQIDNDYRFLYLKTLGDFEIIKDIDSEYVESTKKKGFFDSLFKKLYLLKRNRKKFIGKIYRKLFFNCKKEIEFLKSKNIGVCAFEWSTPFSRGEIVEKYFFAAKGIGITTVALPHGCNLFFYPDANSGYRWTTQKGVIPDESDRNLFDYYIFQNPIRRDHCIKWGQDPVKTQAWGSCRFYPEWSSKNREICPKFSYVENSNKKIKVVFMQFQKNYNLKNELAFETLTKLSNLENILLSVKDSTREGKEYYDKNKKTHTLGKSLVGWYGNDVHSPALIDWADIVIVVGGSSIGVEVILQGKILIHPIYLDTNTTLYEYFQAAHCPDSYEELEKLINFQAKGNVLTKLKGTESLLKEIIYAGKEEFNVPKKYYHELKKINLNYGQTIK